jgi:hypothetical protein
MPQRFIVILLILLTISNFSLGQKYMFSSTGTMAPSHFYIDTVIKTKLKPNGKIIFNNLDSSHTDSFHLRSFFATKYDSILRDTFEYFILVNLTKKAIRFRKLNQNLEAEEIVNMTSKGFKPISYFLYPSCGTSFERSDLVVNPAEILIIKNLVTRSRTFASSSHNCFARLQTSTNGVVVSTPYKKKIDLTRFYLNANFEKDYFFLKIRFAFTQK